jgi:hypothetical protein
MLRDGRELISLLGAQQNGRSRTTGRQNEAHASIGHGATRNPESGKQTTPHREPLLMQRACSGASTLQCGPRRALVIRKSASVPHETQRPEMHGSYPLEIR